MANEAFAAIGIAVDGDGDIAGGAGGGVPAVAEEEGGEAAAVEKKDGLLFAVESVAERLDKFGGEELACAAHIDKFDGGEVFDGPEL
jgi:hypothetical protein